MFKQKNPDTLYCTVAVNAIHLGLGKPNGLESPSHQLGPVIGMALAILGALGGAALGGFGGWALGGFTGAAIGGLAGAALGGAVGMAASYPWYYHRYWSPYHQPYYYQPYYPVMAPPVYPQYAMQWVPMPAFGYW
jgi:hypothetical protein